MSAAKPYRTKPGAYKHVHINVLDELPHDRYVLVLERMRSAIDGGRPLEFYDDRTPGDKSMGCSWGLCDQSARTWPDAQDHTFPVDFELSGRISELDLKDSDRCPMDARSESDFNGCFYKCRVFQAGKKAALPTKEMALALYDNAIAKATGAKP